MLFYQVFVVTKERKQGLGELLMIAAQVEAIARGAHLSHLLVCDRNEGAVKLYKKLGFDTMFQSNDETHNLLMGKSPRDRIRYHYLWTSPFAAVRLDCSK